MSASALRFRIGARTLATIPRRLVHVALSLDEALSGIVPALPALARGDDGWLVTSLPDAVRIDWPGLVVERQRYVRYHVDLAAGEQAWSAGLSGQTRSALKRKARRVAEAGGVVRRYRTAADLAAFHAPARAISAMTYQERLMAAGFPADPAFGLDRAAHDAVRGWILWLDGRPIAYLWCAVRDDTLCYDHVGHDPAHGALSPGTVLMAAALGDLFADRFRRFDFTEGEGQHKRLFASGGVACRDLLLLRDTLANHAAATAMGGFDAAVRVAKRAATHPALAGLARRARRA